MQPRHNGEPAATDWDRADWVSYADRLLAGARVYASPDHARITLPGAEGGYGRAVDGLEGFARTFILAAFRLAGEQGRGLEELADFYARGVEAGVDARCANRWVRMDEHAQAKVEAASIALSLDMTRPWIWDQLAPASQGAIIEYLAAVVGDRSYPRTNWLWFRVVVETFLRSVGGPWSQEDIDEDLALHDSFYQGDGWLSDGAERAYDHYGGWALQLYPVLWARMHGAEDLAGTRVRQDVARLDRFLLDALALVGGNGSPLIQGRSLIYRFAAAAPFWAGVLAEVPSSSPGQLRHAANAVVGHFAAAGVPGRGEVLTMGWHHEWRALAQGYSGPGSPYWAVKGLLGVALPAGHPVWSAAAEPLPVECGDTLRVISAPGWLVSGTQADGIVRVINHGTDHARPGELTADSPLYARLGYSTATSPLLDADAWRNPLEQAVAITDASGRATHRTAMEPLAVRIDDSGAVPVAVGGSTWQAHWVATDERQQRHGSGLVGVVEGAGRVTVVSLVRGPWEFRLVRVDDLADGLDAVSLRLRIGGWALSGASSAGSAGGTAAEVTDGTRRSRLAAVPGHAVAIAGWASREDADPLGPVSVVPYLEVPVTPGQWVAVLSELGEPHEAAVTRPAAEFSGGGGALTAGLRWPDGAVTETNLPALTPSTANR
ncbi:MAG TPA: DUF2264 domain-containing protein [Trebonia sp.]